MTNQIICQINPDVPPTGSDLGIINAARKSFGRRSEWDKREVTKGDAGYRGPSSCTVLYTEKVLKPKDKRLLEFLIRGMTADDFDKFKESIESSVLGIQDGVPECYEDLVERLWEWRNTPSHDTPVNHGFFSFEVKAPIFVARHLVKHEYLIMSEYSRRYITDDVEFYTPEVWRAKADDVKQGSSTTLGIYNENDVEVTEYTKYAMDLYNRHIDAGVAPEQARMVLPQSLMTSWTWSGTLGAFGNMCKLRLSKDTQYETRLVAEQVYTELKKQFPVAAPMIVEGVF
jgi:thymidylate synthase (FAD)